VRWVREWHHRECHHHFPLSRISKLLETLNAWRHLALCVPVYWSRLIWEAAPRRRRSPRRSPRAFRAFARLSLV
jgi:hypothetical protein